MKKIIGIIAVILFTMSAHGQQDAQYTQYMYNMNILNPAYAGSKEALNINFLARSQWVGFDGAPKTITLGVHSPVGKNVGLGLSVIADKLGPLEEQNIYGDFSYNLTLDNNAKLALGLKAGYTFYNLCIPCLKGVTEGDALINNLNPNKAFPNFGVGAFYYTNKFYAGLSIPNLDLSILMRVYFTPILPIKLRQITKLMRNKLFMKTLMVMQFRKEQVSI